MCHGENGASNYHISTELRLRKDFHNAPLLPPVYKVLGVLSSPVAFWVSTAWEGREILMMGGLLVFGMVEEDFVNVRRMQTALLESVQRRDKASILIKALYCCFRHWIQNCFMCGCAVSFESVLGLLGPEWVFYTPCLLKQDGKGL